MGCLCICHPVAPPYHVVDDSSLSHACIYATADHASTVTWRAGHSLVKAEMLYCLALDYFAERAGVGRRCLEAGLEKFVYLSNGMSSVQKKNFLLICCKYCKLRP